MAIWMKPGASTSTSGAPTWGFSRQTSLSTGHTLSSSKAIPIKAPPSYDAPQSMQAFEGTLASSTRWRCLRRTSPFRPSYCYQRSSLPQSRHRQRPPLRPRLRNQRQDESAFSGLPSGLPSRKKVDRPFVAKDSNAMPRPERQHSRRTS